MCDLDPKVKVIGQKAGICDGVPSTSALVYLFILVSRVGKTKSKNNIGDLKDKDGELRTDGQGKAEFFLNDFFASVFKVE